MFRTEKNVSSPSDGFREAVPDVYALYEENQRLKEGQALGCPVCPVMRELDAESRQKAIGYAEALLDVQIQLEAQEGGGGALRLLAEQKAPAFDPDIHTEENPSPEMEEVRERGPEYGDFVSLPLYEGVAAGEPLETIDAGEVFRVPLSRLHGNPDQYFAIRVRGRSMVDAGIRDGGIAVIRKDKHLVSGQIVLARHEGEYTIKRYIELEDGTARLAYEDGTGRSVEIAPGHWENLGVFCFMADRSVRRSFYVGR